MRLYKYLPPSRTDIFKNLTIRFTQAQDFNDPFEILPNIEAVIPPEQLHGYLAQFEEEAKGMFRRAIAEAFSNNGLPPQLADLFPYAVVKELGFDYVGVMERLLPLLVETNREKLAKNLQQSVGGRLGILSLAENPTSLLMWAHYASSHEGFLLEFDSSHAFFNQTKKAPGEVFGSLFPVTYSTDRPAITMFDPTADEEIWAQTLIAQVFLTKSIDWSYEREWRMFLPLDDPSRPHITLEGGIHLFGVPAAALTGVVLGARAKEGIRSEIEAALLSNRELRHVRVLEAKISIRRFEVTIGRAAEPPLLDG